MSAPVEIQAFISFASVLRNNGFVVSPEQTIDFLKAIQLLGPYGIDDIRQAAMAVFAIKKEQEELFDSLFRAHFLGMAIAIPEAVSTDEDFEVHEDRGGELELTQSEPAEESGQAATELESLQHRELVVFDETYELRRFQQLAPNRLPTKKANRFMISPHGNRIDSRNTLRSVLRSDGEMINLVLQSRKTRQRPLVVLIDVSGSMKNETDATIRFAHVLVRTAQRAEVFTMGTRLTRITSALRIHQVERSLQRVAALVADIDGGTRIGESLFAFLNVPRYVGLARGAVFVIISDGLERGDPSWMVDGLRRLSLIAWRLVWLTPLAENQDFVPQTTALAASMPYLDILSSSGNTSDVVDTFLNLAQAA